MNCRSKLNLGNQDILSGLSALTYSHRTSNHLCGVSNLLFCSITTVDLKILCSTIKELLHSTFFAKIFCYSIHLFPGLQRLYIQVNVSCEFIWVYSYHLFYPSTTTVFFQFMLHTYAIRISCLLCLHSGAFCKLFLCPVGPHFHCLHMSFLLFVEHP